MTDVSDSGLLTTASNVLFSGSREGHFFALDARNGKLLWQRYLGGQIAASPITYEIDGKQFVSVASGHAIFAFRCRGSRRAGPRARMDAPASCTLRKEKAGESAFARRWRLFRQRIYA